MLSIPLCTPCAVAVTTRYTGDRVLQAVETDVAAEFGLQSFLGLIDLFDCCEEVLLFGAKVV
jgi:hypothetical protein